MKQRETKIIHNSNQKRINYSDTNVNGATQTLTNKLNNKFQVMDTTYLRSTRKK